MNAPFPLPPLVEDLGLPYRLCPARGQPSALLVLLHGVGANETSLAGLVPLLPEHVTTALVRSPFQMAPGAYSAFTVNFTAAGPVIDPAQAESSRRTLVDVVGQLQARSGLAPARTAIAGFSQGGIMSAGVALTRPDTVAGFAIMSGRILPEIGPLIAPAAALARLHGLIIHGDGDDRLPVHFAEQSAALLTRLGVPFTDRRYAMAHEITRASALDFVAWLGALLPATPA